MFADTNGNLMKPATVLETKKLPRMLSKNELQTTLKLTETVK